MRCGRTDIHQPHWHDVAPATSPSITPSGIRSTGITRRVWCDGKPRPNHPLKTS